MQNPTTMPKNTLNMQQLLYGEAHITEATASLLVRYCVLMRASLYSVAMQTSILCYNLANPMHHAVDTMPYPAPARVCAIIFRLENHGV